MYVLDIFSVPHVFNLKKKEAVRILKHTFGNCLGVGSMKKAGMRPVSKCDVFTFRRKSLRGPLRLLNHCESAMRGYQTFTACR